MSDQSPPPTVPEILERIAALAGLPEGARLEPGAGLFFSEGEMRVVVAALDAVTAERDAHQAEVLYAAELVLEAFNLVSDADRGRLESLDSHHLEPAVGALRLAMQRAGEAAPVETARPPASVVARLLAAAESHADGNPGDGCWAFAGWIAALTMGKDVPDFSALTQAQGEDLSDRSTDLIRAALAGAPSGDTPSANAFDDAITCGPYGRPLNAGDLFRETPQPSQGKPDTVSFPSSEGNASGLSQPASSRPWLDRVREAMHRAGIGFMDGQAEQVARTLAPAPSRDLAALPEKWEAEHDSAQETVREILEEDADQRPEGWRDRASVLAARSDVFKTCAAELRAALGDTPDLAKLYTADCAVFKVSTGHHPQCPGGGPVCDRLCPVPVAGECSCEDTPDPEPAETLSPELEALAAEIAEMPDIPPRPPLSELLAGTEFEGLAVQPTDHAVHACLVCAPDRSTPGPGCINCRQTGYDQTPCVECPGAAVQPTEEPGDRCPNPFHTSTDTAGTWADSVCPTCGKPEKWRPTEEPDPVGSCGNCGHSVNAHHADMAGHVLCNRGCHCCTACQPAPATPEAQQ